MRLLIIIIFSIIGVAEANLVKFTSIKVECSGGGENGYNSSQLNCDLESGKYSLKCSGKGYEKAILCNDLYKDSAISLILKEIQNSISKSVQLDTSYSAGNYNVKLKIQDAYNYSYSIVN